MNDNNNSIVPGFDNEKDDSLKISLEKIDSVPNGLRVYLNGYIDTYNSSFFQKKITKVVVTIVCNDCFAKIHSIFNLDL